MVAVSISVVLVIKQDKMVSGEYFHCPHIKNKIPAKIDNPENQFIVSSDWFEHERMPVRIQGLAFFFFPH